MSEDKRKEELDSEVLDTENMESGSQIQFKGVELFKDTIQFNRAPDELSKKILEEYKKLNKKEDAGAFLAGDLSEEYYLTESNTIQNIKKFFIEDLSNRFKMPIENISFSGKSTAAGMAVEHIWVNEMKPNEYNPLHNHSGILSFVWYLDFPEEIRKECYNQKSNSRSRGLIQFLSNCGDESVIINPRTNDVLIFNACQRHEVYPFYSNNKRISMAGNITKIIFENGLTIEAMEYDTTT